MEVAYSAPLVSKRRTGRPKATTSCLNIQPSDLQGHSEKLVDICIADETDETVEMTTVVKKRGRKPKNKEPIDEETTRKSKRFKKN